MQLVEFLPALHQRLLGGAKCQGLLASPRERDYKIDPRGKACDSLFLYSLLSKHKCVIIPRIYSQAKGNSLPPMEGTMCKAEPGQGLPFMFTIAGLVAFLHTGVRSPRCSPSGLFACS